MLKVAINRLESDPSQTLNYRALANCIRVLTMDAIEKAQSGHPGMPLGMADVATILFSEFLNFAPHDPKWLNRDRFILSAGHGSMLLYSLLYLTGYQDITLDDIKQFRQLHSKAAGHPEYGMLAGIETTTGPLGQGLANAVGMELARNIHSSKLTEQTLDHNTYVVVGDGCLMEGISHEACSLAGHLKLSNLIVLYDSNNITIDGERGLSDSEDALQRFKAYGWHVQEIDGHNFDQIREALHAAKQSSLPSLIACKTKIGYGTPTKEGKNTSHGAPLGEEEIRKAKENYGWSPDETFFVPDELLKAWREIGQRSVKKYRKWQEKVTELSDGQRKLLKSIEHFNISEDILKDFAPIDTPEATRASSGKILAQLLDHVPLIGGSADLTGSNNTKASSMSHIDSTNFKGNYIYYGVREHAMGAIMNGISIYGGHIPYGGSFLVFMDYAKPALRMAALMGLQVIYVMTHDSIGVGEDGPTHHPIEQINYLRSMPNVNVFRPADSIETTECWRLALQARNTPSVLCLTRQKVPQARKKSASKNLCTKGAYIISEHTGELQVTIFATGSEVSVACDAQELLHTQGIGTRVISVPCMELFEQQDESYKNSLLDNDSIKVAIEPTMRFGWDRYIGRDGIFVGMDGFGVSAPYKDLYKFFGITKENVVTQVIDTLRRD